jgi:hypothetical protein
MSRALVSSRTRSYGSIVTRLSPLEAYQSPTKAYLSPSKPYQC